MSTKYRRLTVLRTPRLQQSRRTANRPTVLSLLAVSGTIVTRDTGHWLSLVSNALAAAQATLPLFLVILTYNLFASASRVTEQNERIHRISQLPIVVAAVRPLAFDPAPSYQIEIMNEGSGPALDINVTFDYLVKGEPSDDAAARASALPRSAARVCIGVLNKASQTGLLRIDAQGIMMDNPGETSTSRRAVSRRSPKRISS
jgi:hypothetical protein